MHDIMYVLLRYINICENSAVSNTNAGGVFCCILVLILEKTLMSVVPRKDCEIFSFMIQYIVPAEYYAVISTVYFIVTSGLFCIYSYNPEVRL
jgi:hypothetical protein